jgi:hypothetical protein
MHELEATRSMAAAPNETRRDTLRIVPVSLSTRQPQNDNSSLLLSSGIRLSSWLRNITKDKPMKNKSLKIVSAITIILTVLGTTLYAQGTDSRIGSIARERQDTKAIEAKSISKADAEKQYPSRGGNYPVGQRDAQDASIVVSPYPPHERYDCSKVAHGALVVDVKANKVFVRP